MYYHQQYLCPIILSSPLLWKVLPVSTNLRSLFTNRTQCPSNPLISLHILCHEELLFRQLSALAWYCNCHFTTFLPFRRAHPTLSLGDHKGTPGMGMPSAFMAAGQGLGPLLSVHHCARQCDHFPRVWGCRIWETLASHPLSILQPKWSLKEKTVIKFTTVSSSSYCVRINPNSSSCRIKFTSSALIYIRLARLSCENVFQILFIPLLAYQQLSVEKWAYRILPQRRGWRDSALN